MIISIYHKFLSFSDLVICSQLYQLNFYHISTDFQDVIYAQDGLESILAS